MPARPETTRPAAQLALRWRELAAGALLVLAAFAVYWPALRGQFLWDDFLGVHRNPLVTGELGVASIWFRRQFPLANVALWLEWLAWGEHPLGYHVVNVLLHAAGALLLWRVLARLRIPAAWLAAMIFTVHPVCVASVAWISELKNTLSLPFYLLSLLWYLRFDSEARSAPLAPAVSPSYWLSLLAFVLALLSKTSTVMLPVVLLGCAWWQRGRIGRRDWLPVGPFFVLALVFGLMTIGLQAREAIGGATVQSENFWGRLAGAGMALWFYLGKALLPLNQCMIYPRWQIDAGAALSYLPLLLWCGVLAVCWGLRRTWGRHVLFGLGCFTVMLFPVLGFLDMFFLALSRVSDHLTYLPLTAVAALAAAGLNWAATRIFHTPVAAEISRGSDPEPGLLPNNVGGCASSMSPTGRAASRAHSLALGLAGGGVVLALAVTGMLRARVFVSEEALWRDTLAKNPTAWCAHANLGWMMAEQKKYDEARAHLEASLAVRPENAQAHSNLGRVLSLQGHFAQAEPHFQTALRIKPTDSDIRRAYASALAEQGRIAEAVEQLRETLRLRPNVDARLQLATLLYQTRNFRDAAAEYRQVLAVQSDHLESLNNVAWILATCSDGSVRNGAEAVRFAERACRASSYTEARPLSALAAAYAEVGRFSDAVVAAQKSIAAASAVGDARLAAVGQQLLQLYRAGKPYHDNAPSAGDRQRKAR
ncbi:MAG TPA: tetratricopeptide repeat protein [Candidatus Paceibacterota bacterium]|nr:tetratricopeptide repeat protein [Candidatus Paceibacterota bacterium]